MHGWPGLVSAYVTVQAPMALALIRGHAPLHKVLLSPLVAAPLTLFAGVGVAATSELLSVFGLAAGGMLQVGTALGSSAALGYAAGRAIARQRHVASVHQRGAMVSEAPAPPQMARRQPGRSSRVLGRYVSGVTLAGWPVAVEDETKHFKFIGTTGTGKSTAICEMLSAALERGDRAVIADPDAGYLRRFYNPQRGDAILNPFDPRSAKWDLFGEISNDYDVDQLARSLIPDHEGQDRSWRGYARTFFTAVTAQARAAGTQQMSELYRLLVVAGSSELRTLVAGTPAQPFLEEHNGRMFDSIRSVTSSAVAALEYVARQRSVPLAVRDWVRGTHSNPAGVTPGAGVLFMPYRASQIAALRSTISAWMRLAIFEAMNREEGDQRLWFVVDELDALGQIDGLKDALARLRKFGGRCVLGFQSVAQVSSTYGGGEAQTLVENCGNTLILRCSGSEHGGTSQFASRLIGEREVMRITTSSSRRATDFVSSLTHTQHVGIESAVMGSEIEQLPDLSGYLKLASSPAWRLVRLDPASVRGHQAAKPRAARVVSFPVPGAARGCAADAAHTADHARQHPPADHGLEAE